MNIYTIKDLLPSGKVDLEAFLKPAIALKLEVRTPGGFVFLGGFVPSGVVVSAPASRWDGSVPAGSFLCGVGMFCSLRFSTAVLKKT